MNFTKYQHVERLGTTETDGILDGDVLVFPKIDGTNCSVWLGDDGDVHCSNRNKEIMVKGENTRHFSDGMNRHMVSIL